ncbi:MAG: helix-turn-helix transcriptional regulator [Pseudomonadota bacterium]
MITPEQCRAARALLDWTQKDLAERANISNQTVRNFEHRTSQLKDSTAKLLRMIFEAEGVVLLDPNGGGPGARLAKPVEE